MALVEAIGSTEKSMQIVLRNHPGALEPAEPDSLADGSNKSAQDEKASHSLSIQSAVIVDVGANNGDDTCFYLRKGFRVVAIEADPELAASLWQQFAPYVAVGQLDIKQIAVADAKKVVTFFKNTLKSDWSSICVDTKATQRHSYQRLDVQGDTLSSILEDYPDIYYLKLDIEGGELAAIRSLAAVPTKPKFLSYEVNPDWLDILQLLQHYGYHSFKLITQDFEHLQPPPKPALEGNYVECHFTGYMSGTFGHETPGDWKSYDDLVAQMLEITEEQNRIGGGYVLWHDIYAMS